MKVLKSISTKEKPKKKRSIILASRSTARKEILKMLGYRVIVVVPVVEETRVKKGSLEYVARIVEQNALRKAQKTYEVAGNHPVVAADTLIYIDGIVYGKPKDEKEARNTLLHLRGREHIVVTGYAVLYRGEKIVGHRKTIVKMRNFIAEELEYYLSTKEYLGKAGAYSIQGLGGTLVEEIRGCYYNVVGLPLPDIIECFVKLKIWPPEIKYLSLRR